MAVQGPSPLELSAGWGIVEADSTVIGLVVATVAVFALIYVVMRVRGDQSRKAGKASNVGKTGKGKKR